MNRKDDNIIMDNLITKPESLIRVMVVDDHPNTAAMLARAISQLGDGIEALNATSGKQAIELAGDTAIDILITDMMMPEMNGLELIEYMLNNPAGRPACKILMTAYDVPGLKETARRLNINEVLIKPIPPERVRKIVSQVLDDSGLMTNMQANPESQSPFTILIADDYIDNISLLARYLKNEGYKFITAHDGIETLNKARAEMPDLILLDVNMPGKDGMKVLQELRADPATENIPVIILTAARVSPSDMQYGLNLGADDYVTKPFDRLELFARIRTKLRVKSAEDKIRKRNRELSVLPEIGKELSARLDYDEISNLVLKRAVEALGALKGDLLILNLKNPFHREYHISNNKNTKSLRPIANFNLLIEKIKASREYLLIDNTQNTPYWQPSTEDDGQSVMIIPIFGRSELIGMLMLTHERKGYFNPEHLALTQAIASQAGIAFENCRLYTDLEKEQNRISAVLHSAADAILMFDSDGCLSILNPTARKLFPADDVQLGLPFPQNGQYQTLITSLEKTFESGKSYTTEIRWQDDRVFTANFTPLEDGGCVLLLHDVSNFKRLERVKNEFIATASHDLKNPLTSIKGYSQLILQKNSSSEMQIDFAQRIHHASNNMTELIDNMLDLAKMDLNPTSNFQPIEIYSMLSEIVDEYKLQAQSKNQTLTLDGVKDICTVLGDSLKMRQVFRNLIGNAIKYTPADGSIQVSAKKEAEKVRIKIADTGYGIPAADLPHIFDRFYRVRDNGHDEVEGNGLGLAIVKTIVEQHGGQITVESKKGKGSCFSVNLSLTKM